MLILQHPQEPDKEINSAILLHRSLPHSVLKVGLSWRNLGHALGEEANPKEWLVLYLGSAKLEQTAAPGLVLVSKDGNVLPAPKGGWGFVKGIVVLDGTWSQAKTLWWRNAWLLKLQRALVVPEGRSRYGELRKEPRHESVSTLEAAALALAVLERNPVIQEDLTTLFDKFLDRVRASGYRPPRRAGKGRQRRFRGGRRRG